MRNGDRGSRRPRPAVGGVPVRVQERTLDDAPTTAGVSRC
ncbi:hypothetical protein GZL_00276 [Streptomyces sp. 769]|nr:hypothetical protein GZL_00276 [Streptomyces sp. 769]